MARASDWRTALRMYGDLSEEEFIALPAAERDAQGPRYIERVGAINALARAVIERARRLRQSGDVGAAEKLIECVRRLAAANSGPDTLALANVIAQGIDRRIADFERD